MGLFLQISGLLVWILIAVIGLLKLYYSKPISNIRKHLHGYIMFPITVYHIRRTYTDKDCIYALDKLTKNPNWFKIDPFRGIYVKEFQKRVSKINREEKNDPRRVHS